MNPRTEEFLLAVAGALVIIGIVAYISNTIQNEEVARFENATNCNETTYGINATPDHPDICRLNETTWIYCEYQGNDTVNGKTLDKIGCIQVNLDVRT